MKANIFALLAGAFGIGHSTPGMFTVPDSKPPRGARAAKLAVNRGRVLWFSQRQGTYINPFRGVLAVRPWVPSGQRIRERRNHLLELRK